MGWLEECEKAASELTQEKRQEFLNLILEGKTIGRFDNFSTKPRKK